MTLKGAAVQGGLALAGLVLAYATWQRPKDAPRPDAVELVAATRQSLEKVRFDDGQRFVEVARRGGAEPRLWTTRGYLPGKRPAFDAGVPAADGGVADAGVSRLPPPEPPPTREVFASERAEGLFGRFTPLEAARGLGTLSSAKLDELGLAGSERHLEVTVAGQVRRFLASKPVPGLLGSYLQDLVSGQVYLAPAGLLTELDPASEVLVERRLHVFKLADVDRFTLAAGGASVDFTLANAEVPATARVARAATPDKPDELARNWHEKAWTRLVVTEVLGAGEVPKAGAPEVAVRLDYLQRGARKGFLELAVDPQKHLWARSENTAGWVAVHQGAEEVVAEAKKLLAP